MTNAIGEFSLFLSLVVAAYASAAAWIGWRIQRGEWIRSGEYALHALFGLLTISTVALIYALVTHDFSLAYVVNYSNRTQSMAYTISALYGGNAMFAVVNVVTANGQDLPGVRPLIRPGARPYSSFHFFFRSTITQFSSKLSFDHSLNKKRLSGGKRLTTMKKRNRLESWQRSNR